MFLILILMVNHLLYKLVKIFKKYFIELFYSYIKWMQQEMLH